MAASDAGDDELIGQTFGREGAFTIRTRLGEGGMGTVYEAWDNKREKRRAIKFLRPEHVSSPEAAERFKREGERFRDVQHEHLVRIYGLGRERGLFYIVTEFVEGHTLHAKMKLGAMPVREALTAARQIAAGLAALHEHRIVHRDLKPANVMLAEPHQAVKVLDFGLAKFMDDSSGLTQVGFWLGTPGYAAPEQIRGQEIDHRADLFALGAILYRLLTGHRAFDGPNDRAAVDATLKDQPRRPSELLEGLAPGVDRLVMELLEKKPQRRPETATEVVQALEALLAGKEPARPNKGWFGGRS